MWVERQSDLCRPAQEVKILQPKPWPGPSDSELLGQLTNVGGVQLLLQLCVHFGRYFSQPTSSTAMSWWKWPHSLLTIPLMSYPGNSTWVPMLGVMFLACLCLENWSSQGRTGLWVPILQWTSCLFVCLPRHGHPSVFGNPNNKIPQRYPRENRAKRTLSILAGEVHVWLWLHLSW